MSERYYMMIGETVLGDSMEERVRRYHNTRPEYLRLERAIEVASKQCFDTIVTVVE